MAQRSTKGQQKAGPQANAQRGELGFIADGTQYVLSMGINALCHMETPGPHNPDGRKFHQMLAQMRSGGTVELRLLLWAALQTHHAGEIVTVEQAGDLVDRAGGPKGLLVAGTALINQLIALNGPPAAKSDGTAPKQGERPPTAKPGTGAAST